MYMYSVTTNQRVVGGRNGVIYGDSADACRDGGRNDLDISIVYGMPGAVGTNNISTPFSDLTLITVVKELYVWNFILYFDCD